MIVRKVITLSLVFILSMMICSCGNNSDEIAVKIEDIPETEDTIAELISDEQAIDAIRKYCCAINPDLESIAAEEYPVYWEIISSDDSEIVVLFRSYTGSQVRYYINRATGITNITEFVPGITDEEEPTGETFNIRDFYRE